MGGAHHPELLSEIFEHVSLMTPDAIMKCAFSQEGSNQTDRSVMILELQGFCFYQLIQSQWRGSSGRCDAHQLRKQEYQELLTMDKFHSRPNLDSATDP